ncbi:peptide ABC transporter ATP-binding protein [Brevibacillus choshinensis]|uniref:Nickel import system ATP-binding protein NikD n=1 Tax=Brevibacillus choshinensis TaxID=54911 RepID=A0ABR5NCX8_BRECH|nr:ABC transporter ATP-binding protein [Brevibacillus choshinensis]KQL49416.1 peptide ABC transporter ATP-binding protein [Brevibacillus choshinensis]
METLLKIKNLKIDYAVRGGTLSAVNNVSLDIKPKEIFAFLGESGCGKSTLSLAIMRLLMDRNTSVSGEIEFKGTNLLTLSNHEMNSVRGRQIGMIFQNPLDSLNPVYRSGTQVYEALTLDKVTRQQAWSKVLQLYQDVKIPDAERRMKSFPNEMSGGMRQRVMIAMMLSRNPELLIADEPTTALDVTTEAQILNIMRSLRDQYGTAILVITHNLGIVAEIADRVGVMYAGELVEMGDVNTIFENPLHPYTKALMKALPRQSKNVGRISTIEGTVPRIIGEYNGCRFANRCPFAVDICGSKTPTMREITTGHFVSCHREEIL